jgi:branched-chain amino acid transport system substrate-binding protein
MSLVERRFRLFAAILAVAALFAAACGQKPGVAEQMPVGAFGGGAMVDPDTGLLIDPETGLLVDPETGELIDPETGEAVDPGTVGAGGGGGQAAADTDTGAGPGDQQRPTGPGDTTGVTNTSVKIGVHAPLTGAAPVPSQSADRGTQMYWRWLREQNRDIHGRDVQVVLRNDNYNPSQAVSVCKEMVERDEVFMLSGIGGTDQIQACARYAATVGVPYASTGVTEIGLANLPNYFAISMSYKAQGPLLARFMVSQLGARNRKNGLVWFNTPNFRDARDAFFDGMRRVNARVDYERAVSKNADFGTAQTVVQEMNSQGIENVYVLTSPVWFIELVKASNSQGYNPRFTGVGLTMTLDTVLSAGCPSGPALDGAKFFSPFPAWVDSNKFDQNFRRASQRFYNNDGDDIMFLAWGASKGFHQMLDEVGRQLSREAFVHTVRRAQNLRTNIFPPLSYSPNDPFGARHTHVSEARCGSRRWHTIISFASDF